MRLCSWNNTARHLIKGDELICPDGRLFPRPKGENVRRIEATSGARPMGRECACLEAPYQLNESLYEVKHLKCRIFDELNGLEKGSMERPMLAEMSDT